MKLYETFGKQGFHTTVATSFGIDFGAYENVMLARLRGAGCFNNLVAADSAMLTLALEGGSELPRHAGRSYTVTPVGGSNLFHPKLVLQLGRSAGRLIVSSANITAAGLAGNLEVTGAVETEDKGSGEARVIAAGWAFLSGFLDRNLEGVRQQVEWMEARTPWLRDIEPANGVVKFADGSDGAFFASGADTGIAERFLACLDERIQRLIVISPYWDEDLAALNELMARTAAPEGCILLDHGRHVFAPEKIAREHRKRVKLIDYHAGKERRFIHAKVIIAQSRTRDYVLYGSANCTRAALGGPGFTGINAEACLYRSLAAGAALDSLCLSDVLTSEPLSPQEFESAKRPEELPRSEAAARFPGHFTCRYDELVWAPPPGADAKGSRIELLGNDGSALKAELKRLPDGEGGVLRFRIAAKERPSFARVWRPDGSVSARAIVAIVDKLREAVRDARSRQVDEELAALEGETQLGLWLLETLNALEAAEATLAGRDPGPGRRAKVASADEGEAPPDDRRLTYDQFMAGRRLRSEIEGIDRDSLAGSHVSHIRGFLNRLLDFGRGETDAGPEEGTGEKSAFDLGDETADPEGATESGVEFNNRTAQARVRPGGSGDAQADMRTARQRRASRREIIAAVDELTDRVEEKVETTGLGCVDVLRLRAMLMITAAGGWNGEEPSANLLQVLPPAGDADGAWPRLLGRALFVYFGGRDPAIRTLVLDGFHDQLTDDVLECWATCMWAVQAAIMTATRHRERQAFIRSLASLRSAIYRGIALRQDELQDPRILRMLDVLNERFGVTLRLDGNAIVSAHRDAAKSLQMTG